MKLLSITGPLSKQEKQNRPVNHGLFTYEACQIYTKELTMNGCRNRIPNQLLNKKLIHLYSVRFKFEALSLPWKSSSFLPHLQATDPCKTLLRTYP